MFASIAKNYDRANTLFSFGLHKRWNNKLIQSVQGARNLLDLCSGTGEIAFGFLKRNPKSKAILLDFCHEMLQIAEKKGAAFSPRFETVQADAQVLPLQNKCVEAVTISYGIRNVKDPLKCFHEVFRVLKPNGVFAILELTRPQSGMLRFFHKIYLKTLLPLLGRLAAKNIDAYRYLAKSVETFISPKELENKLHEAGFNKIEQILLFKGTATIFLATKN